MAEPPRMICRGRDTPHSDDERACDDPEIEPETCALLPEQRRHHRRPEQVHADHRESDRIDRVDPGLQEQFFPGHGWRRRSHEPRIGPAALKPRYGDALTSLHASRCSGETTET